MENKEIRRANLRLLWDEFYREQTAKGIKRPLKKDFADRYEMNDRHVSQILSPKKISNIGDGLARQLERLHKPKPLEVGWMDHDHSNNVTVSPQQAMLRRVMNELILNDPDGMEQLLLQYIKNRKAKK